MADQAIVERSCTKLQSAIGDEAINFTGDLQEMLDTLVDIQAVMPDTERLSDGFKSETRKEWVKKVRTAAYGVSDLVDEFKMQSARTPAAGKMTKRVDLPEKKMSDKMKEIKEKLKGLLKESIEFKTRASNPISVPPGDIVGRDEDREKIFARLSARNASEGPIILLIAGEEGVGKTTVAEMVFNDTRFRCYSRVWVNMSDELHKIGKSIISQLSGKEEMSRSADDMDSITERLHELLNGMKVLVVLDDLFIFYDEWNILRQMFSVTDEGSQVVVIALATTTIQIPTDSVIQLYSLDLLKDDMCCTIIKQLASHSDDRSTRMDLERIAPEIAELCSGLPLAAQLFGRLLKFKHYEEWPTLLDKSLWSTDNPVNLSLELSYRSMPPNLRLCFAYCTLLTPFINYERLVKEDLIHQWIALGLIEPSDGTMLSAIKLAEEYIGRLLDLSFLQTVDLPQASGKDDTGAILFKMHGSIRGFGLKVIEADLWVVDDAYDCSETEHCRYVVINEYDAWPTKSLPADRKISAIMCLHCSKMELRDDPFSVPSCLRVLNLEKTSIQELPHSICQLEQLGYLNLSGCSRLVNLPEIFGDLKNLLHINLSGCSELENLPESFGKLKNLRHINLSGCSGIVTLPESFGKLINLVHIDLSGCHALKNLQEVFGKLANLMHLNLSGCSGLVTLPGSFGKLIKLVRINLSNCSGLVKLPQSFGKLKSLVHINLSGCSGLLTLPKSFGDLRNLSHIDLCRCYGLSKLPESFGRLISLVYISLSGCSGLVTLPESFGGLRNLLRIDLSRCYGLSKLPESFRNLRKLVYLDLSFWSCFEGIETALSGLTSLEHLNLSHPCCYRADHIHLEGLKEVFGKLSRLQYLNLSMLLNPISYSQSEEKNCEYVGCISGLYSLEHLDLSHNIFLRDLPESLSGLYRLHTLDLSGCIRLKKLGKWMTQMYSLKTVVLRDCEGLESYRFEVGADNNINNYVQIEEVTSKVLEITCLERIKRLEEAQRIKLVQKRKLQKLKLCWTVNSEPVKSVEGNKRDRSMEENEPGRSVIENEHEGSVQENKPDRSAEENKPDRSAEENKPDRSVEENEPGRSVKENEHEGSVHENKPDRSAEENKPDRSMEENKPMVSVEKNKPDKSVKENEPERSVEEIEPEVSVEKNKPDRPVEEIEVASYFNNKPNSSLSENKHNCHVEENVLLGELMPPQNLQCLEIHGYSGEICQPSWLSEQICSAKLLNLVNVTLEDFPSCKTLPPFGLLPKLQQLVVRRMASITRINAGDLIGSNRPAFSSLKFTIDDMHTLEEFNTTYNRGDKKYTLSAIDELVVHKCPCLRFGTVPPRGRLVISECDQGMTSLGEKQEGYEEEGPSCPTTPGTAPGTELVVKSCSKPIYQWSLLGHLSILRSLTIENCSLEKLLGFSDCCDEGNPLPEYLGHLTSLEELKIVSCECFGYLLWIIQKLTSLKSLHFIDCQSLRELPKELGSLTSLEKLAIDRCPRIVSLPDSITELTSLKNLRILDCPSLKKWCDKKDNKKRLGHISTKIRFT